MLKNNYYIWLQEALGVGANVGSKLQFFGSPEAIYKAEEEELLKSGLFTARQIEKLKSTSIENSYKIISECALYGIDIIIPEDELYPPRLKEIENFPLVLYVFGDMSCLLDMLPIAIVGTRKPTAKSVCAAQGLAATLSRCGFTVVSGGALGVDTAAHTGALCSGGKTVAVLGGGIESGYLAENKSLRELIGTQGALISESPPHMKPFAGSFPIRNRIIAALTVGTVVIEAGQKSGSLITSKYAGDFSRDVFALYDNSMAISNAGVRDLLIDGAIIVKTAEDVIKQYMQVYGEDLEPHILKNNVSIEEITKDFSTLGKEENFGRQLEELLKSRSPKSSETQEKQKRKLADSISKPAHRVYDCFENEPLSINNIADKTLLPVNAVMGAVTELEIFGYIELLNNAKYILK